jgi:pteridine reductase
MLKAAGTALITGGARRLGRAMALHLASKGYDIALHCHHSRREAEELLPLIESFARSGRIFEANLTEYEQSEVLMREVVETFPNLSVLIHNASVYQPLRFAETTPADWDTLYALHVKTPFFLTQAFARYCQRGLVICLTDAQAPRTDYFAYSLSKQNLTDFTRLAARALGPEIRVNAIAPGHVLPPVDGNPDPGAILSQVLPLARTGHPEDITRALQVFLDNPYLTGQTLYVDGGQHLL